MRFALLFVLCLAQAGCVLPPWDERPWATSCEVASDCYDQLGRGWICSDQGECEAAAVPARCSSYPEGILAELPAWADSLLIGNLFDFGDFELMQRAARLAVIQVNTRDGLDGQQVGMVECTNEADFEGDGLDENEATAAMSRYLAEVLGVPTIVGPATSTRVEVAYDTSSPFGTLVITPSGGSPALTTLDGQTSTDEEPGLLWRTTPPDSIQGQVIALEMIARDIDRVGIVAEIGADGEGLAEVFQGHFDGAGRSSVLQVYSETSELMDATVDFAGEEYQAVVFVSAVSGDAVGFLIAAGTLSGYADKLIFLTDGAFDVQLIGQVEDHASGLFPNVLGALPAVPSGIAYDIFVANYSAVFDQDPTDFGFTAHAYDAAWLAIAGAAWSWYSTEEITGLDSARGLRNVSSGDDLYIGPNSWNDVKHAFESGESVDLAGASGSLDFDPVTGETSGPINIWTIADGGGDWELSVLYCVDLSPTPRPDCVEPGGP